MKISDRRWERGSKFILWARYIHRINLYFHTHNDKHNFVHSLVQGKAVADPGGAAGARPPMGPDSFVLTYKFFET